MLKRISDQTKYNNFKDGYFISSQGNLYNIPVRKLKQGSFIPKNQTVPVASYRLMTKDGQQSTIITKEVMGSLFLDNEHSIVCQKSLNASDCSVDNLYLAEIFPDRRISVPSHFEDVDQQSFQLFEDDDYEFTLVCTKKAK